jgi:hypothetical protein
MNTVWSTIRTSLVQKVNDIRKSERKSATSIQQQPSQQQPIQQQPSQQQPSQQQPSQQQPSQRRSSDEYDLISATTNGAN